MIPGQKILPRLCLGVAIVVTGAVTAASVGCASRTARPVLPVAPLLTWLGEFTRPFGTIYPQLSDSLRFGSLSGLVHDEASGQWIAVIDDREDSRLAWLSIAHTGKSLDVAPVRMLNLRAGPGVSGRAVTQADLEAITALPDGTFLVAEEGHQRDGEFWQPALLRVTRDGVVTGVIDFPAEFHLTGDDKTGLRDNQGFESLTRTPRGTVITGLEQPLRQDGNISFERGAPGRLIEFEPVGRTFRARRQWTYMLSPTPAVEGYDAICADGENGLVDLLALSDTRLVSMERACLRDSTSDRITNTVQLYFVELEASQARKTLLLDLGTITHRLSPALLRLDNFEGLAFGPLVNGARTLLVMSDDNFHTTQKTSFLLFGMRY